MGKKVCSKCGEVKEFSEFRKDNKMVLGRRSQCKSCEKIGLIKYNRSKKGLINRIYNSQKNNSIYRGYSVPAYTLCELKKWCLSQDVFHELYYKWVDSKYNKELRPSIDRKNDYKSYTFSNIQIITWRENYIKYCNDAINGINTKRCKGVKKYDLSGNFIEEYYSISEAARQNNMDNKHISSVCKGVKSRGSANGFIWRYA